MTQPNTDPLAGRLIPSLSHCLSLLGCLVLAAIAVRATLSPIFYYDSWWYHLPFSSYIWDIGGGAATFQISPFLMERFKGFPLLWETVQGAFWAATGGLWSITVPQTLLVLFYLYICRSLLSVPIGWLVLGLVACPMVLLHLQGTNNDLPAAIMIAIAFLLMSNLLSNASRPTDWVKAGGLVLAFAIAGNIKYQALIACFAISVILGCGCLFLRGLSLRRRLALIALLTFAMTTANISAIKNFVSYGNPVYPINVSVAGVTLFQGTESSEYEANYPSYLLRGSQPVTFPSPVNFVLSISELDWTMRGVAPWYNMDSVTGGSPRRGPPSRTGGWGLMFVALNLMLILTQLVHIRELHDRQHRILLINVVLLTVLTAFLPRSHG